MSGTDFLCLEQIFLCLEKSGVEGVEKSLMKMILICIRTTTGNRGEMHFTLRVRMGKTKTAIMVKAVYHVCKDFMEGVKG